ncbi:MAG TPA: hypothetical protein VK452_04045 [Dissulfurispiraceae bacterium]|nr:hypothetical protein [Dissulfurispiraceae bacterium]
MKIIDVHAHGIGGYDTRSSDVEHILKIADIFGSFGIAEIIPTVYPATIKVMRKSLGLIKQAMELQASHAVLRQEFRSEKYGDMENFKPARIIGAHLEGPFLNPLRCGSLNAMTLIEPNEYNLEHLTEDFEDIVRIITVSPELDGAVSLIRKISDTGVIANMGHSDATYSEAEAGHKAGARGVTHLFNAMRPFHHREPGIAGYGLLNKDIYIEVIADPYHLHAATIDLIFRAKNPERIIIVSDSIKETKVPATPFSTAYGLADQHGRLLGGSMTITEAADKLSKMHDQNMIMNCISANPERYLYHTVA